MFCEKKKSEGKNVLNPDNHHLHFFMSNEYHFWSSEVVHKLLLLPLPLLDLHTNRTSLPLVSNTRGVKNSRGDDGRTITSLPVSPCSSPLRNYGPAHKSCFLSPPHPSYDLVGHNLSDYPLYSTRPNTLFTHDPPSLELLKGQSPGQGVLLPRRV